MNYLQVYNDLKSSLELLEFESHPFRVKNKFKVNLEKRILNFFVKRLAGIMSMWMKSSS